MHYRLVNKLAEIGGTFCLSALRFSSKSGPLNRIVRLLCDVLPFIAASKNHKLKLSQNLYRRKRNRSVPTSSRTCIGTTKHFRVISNQLDLQSNILRVSWKTVYRIVYTV